ncbi:MAG: amidase [Spirochaetes bacterium]|jgi:Asp-tRNA(Asn)/Glu-tRNA(Gln) amidotransferase A subunit family amidase|nr:amidase [Spirochaetota bacterium]
MTQSSRFTAWKSKAGSQPVNAAAGIHESIRNAPPQAQAAAIARVEDRDELGDAFARSAREAAPLSGIPYMLKDLFNVAGQVTGAGATFLGEAVGAAQDDSALHKLLQGLGGVYAGRTHLNEFAYGLDGMNAHHGNCPNPVDVTRISGGSSSGSAWAVRRGVVPVAFGTDTGGSVRVPAALCGLYGVRLQPDRLAREGVVPLSKTFDSVGWFTEFPHDAASTWEALGHVSAARAWGGRMLYLGRTDTVHSTELQTRYRDLAARLGGETALGTEAQELDAYLAAQNDFHLFSYNVIGSADAYEFHKAYLDQYGDRYEPRVRKLIERGRDWTEDEIERARVIQRETESVILRFLESYDALVCPATHVVAPRFEDAGADYRTRILRLTVAGSLARVPVVTVPVFTEDGLSGGLQFMLHPERHDTGIALLRHLSDG